ncbi:glutathione S-transferase [Clavulina sp. PMI_390]|nr:glutathione S-transferase [Clavulina sp. PMI_390]
MSTTKDAASAIKGVLGLDSKDGHFRRQASTFRNTISPESEFPPEKGRYHLFVTFGCPWAHRTLITRRLKGLEDVIDVTIASPYFGEFGWSFGSGAVAPFPGTQADPLYDTKHTRELYFKANPDYSGRFTVPVLWDKKTQTIVNNESSEIIRILNGAFNEHLPNEKGKELDLYPKSLCQEIDELNEWVYATVNNGVYKTGFATTPNAYESNVIPLFNSLDRLEKILSDGREFLIGGTLTEADIRLFTTMIRFDVAYVGHFKCNLGSIRHDYPHINRWMKNLYWNYPAFKETTNFDHIKVSYYWSQVEINPSRIVPVGPKVNIEPL